MHQCVASRRLKLHPAKGKQHVRVSQRSLSKRIVLHRARESDSNDAKASASTDDPPKEQKPSVLSDIISDIEQETQDKPVADTPAADASVQASASTPPEEEQKKEEPITPEVVTSAAATSADTTANGVKQSNGAEPATKDSTPTDEGEQPTRPKMIPMPPPSPFLSEFLDDIKAESGSSSASDSDTPVPVPEAPAKLPAAPAEESRFFGVNVKNAVDADIPMKIAIVIGIIAFSRLGVYVHLPDVDIQKFSETVKAGKAGLIGYVDQLAGGSLSRVGVFSLGIIPYINASILLQLSTTIWPSLKKLQRDEGPQGRARFKLYTKLATLLFASLQALGQLNYVRPFVDDFSTAWLAQAVIIVVAGSMILSHCADILTEQKLGNGTSMLIFTGIASSIPATLSSVITESADKGNYNTFIYLAAFVLTTLGIVFVQEGERRIPMNYAQRFNDKAVRKEQAYLPLKVNGAGVMPVIFASALLALPNALGSVVDIEIVKDIAKEFTPSGKAYLPANILLIAFFNYYYTFLQFEPIDLSEQLKKNGSSIPSVRPGRATAEFLNRTLTRLSVLGSLFLAILAAGPIAIEFITSMKQYRGFFGTSLLILVGVATDLARRIKAEQAMGKYRNIDKIYSDISMLK